MVWEQGEDSIYTHKAHLEESYRILSNMWHVSASAFSSWTHLSCPVFPAILGHQQYDMKAAVEITNIWVDLNINKTRHWRIEKQTHSVTNLLFNTGQRMGKFTSRPDRKVTNVIDSVNHSQYLHTHTQIYISPGNELSQKDNTKVDYLHKRWVMPESMVHAQFKTCSFRKASNIKIITTN